MEKEKGGALNLGFSPSNFYPRICIHNNSGPGDKFLKNRLPSNRSVAVSFCTPRKLLFRIFPKFYDFFQLRLRRHTWRTE